MIKYWSITISQEKLIASHTMNSTMKLLVFPKLNTEHEKNKRKFRFYLLEGIYFQRISEIMEQNK